MNENLPQAINEKELFKVLSNSLYVGAQEESIKMVLSYCKVNGLDPLQKPVHIVPMYCATGKKDAKGYDVKAMRDVIMPGIGSYRIQAARSGGYAGVSEPVYGDDVSESLDGEDITYPKWCKITVKRLLNNGLVAEFSAVELWKENYATGGKGSVKPNAMWKKRPYAQIAKCAEAQALRKAFPEIGSQPTADEMEGKEIDITLYSDAPEKKEAPTKPEFYDTKKFTANKQGWQLKIESGEKTKAELIAHLTRNSKLSDEQLTEINTWEVQHENA